MLVSRTFGRDVIDPIGYCYALYRYVPKSTKRSLAVAELLVVLNGYPFKGYLIHAFKIMPFTFLTQGTDEVLRAVRQITNSVMTLADPVTRVRIYRGGIGLSDSLQTVTRH